jgi:hypothetical protein
MAQKVRSFVGSRVNRAPTNGSKFAITNRSRAGIGSILDNLNRFIQGVRDVCPEVLIEALEPTMDKAIEYCPVKDGTLRSSAYLETEQFRGRSVAAMGFAKGGQPNYAIYVHEMPYQHEAALDEDYNDITRRVPELIRARMGT